MHVAAKAQLKECDEKNKSGDPFSGSFIAAMTARLKKTVGEFLWMLAEGREQKRKERLEQKRKELQLRATKLLSSGHQDADEDVMMPLTKKSCRRADNAGTNNGGGDV